MNEVSAKELERRLHALFAEPIDDDALRARVTALASSPYFAGLVAVWGPPVYRRSRVMFLPFIRTNVFFSWWSLPRWRGRYEEALEQWLAEADRLDDVELFQGLYRWKVQGTYWRPARAWRRDLVERFRNAPTPHDRAHVLTKYDLGYPIDDETAAALYEIDAATARPFLSGRLYGEVGQVKELARRAGDDELYWALYRRTVQAKQWQEDVFGLCDSVADPDALCAELEKRHPEMLWQHLGPMFLELVRKRGLDVLPYVRRRL